MDSAASLTANVRYFVNPSLAVDLLVAYPFKHDISLEDGPEVGSTKHLPPTLSLFWYPLPDSRFKPFLGAGLNYTIFYDPTPVAALKPISFSDNVGFALQGGADIPVGNGPYFLNFDVKKLFLKTGITATSSGTVRAKASLDPWLIGFGVGVRF